jgi:tetratricopeptide (TPR) repeat protein
MVRRPLRLLVLILFLSSLEARAQGRRIQADEYPGTEGVLRAIKDSKVRYHLKRDTEEKTPEECADLLWPPGSETPSPEAESFVAKGDTLREEGKVEEARDAYVEALAMRPRHAGAVSGLQETGRTQGPLFLPWGYVRVKGGRDVEILMRKGYSEDENVPWVIYLHCRAFWMGETSWRKRATGRSDYVWREGEEAHCLGNLIEDYEIVLEEEKTEEVPWLERIRRIREAGDLDLFILYEMASRLDPAVMTRMKEEVRRRMRDYVEREVVVDYTPPPEAPEVVEQEEEVEEPEEEEVGLPRYCPFTITMPEVDLDETRDRMLTAVQTDEERYEIRDPSELEEIKPEDYAWVMWPPGPDLLFSKVYVREDGLKDLERHACSEETEKVWLETWDLLRKGMVKKFHKEMKAAAAADPDCYAGPAGIGLGFYFKGKMEEALAEFSKSAAANPDDPNMHFLKAWAYYQLRRYPWAVESFEEALVLHPRHGFILEVLGDHASTLGLRLVFEPFEPPVLVRRAEDKVEVYLEEDLRGGPWEAWAACKAYWLGDDEYRETMTGRRVRSWSTGEEAQCLLILMSVYREQRREGAIEEEPQIDRLIYLAKRGHLRQFIRYELASRVMPNLMICADEEEREAMREFIRLYVAVPWRS